MLTDRPRRSTESRRISIGLLVEGSRLPLERAWDDDGDARARGPSGREDGEKVRDARSSGERGQLAGVELGHVLNREMRFVGQGLDIARVHRAPCSREEGCLGHAWL
jgi:hypothetical protein